MINRQGGSASRVDPTNLGSSDRRYGIGCRFGCHACGPGRSCQERVEQITVMPCDPRGIVLPARKPALAGYVDFGGCEGIGQNGFLLATNRQAVNSIPGNVLIRKAGCNWTGGTPSEWRPLRVSHRLPASLCLSQIQPGLSECFQGAIESSLGPARSV